ncbi:putative leucine-rich repeat receptor-like protein kinase [Planoprotostelium fungivorum]|uniref:Putative leucine-rich repeat receptor-like protein kinase n=1 Tax=Planoprotostelium fungivorum TaxID=1890364 RepID=A0A2P6P0F1_9EUKA|nr:putative leucine-rich repeat receptor-like protein kinase [Planoprotostelium fungivorum]
MIPKGSNSLELLRSDYKERCTIYKEGRACGVIVWPKRLSTFLKKPIKKTTIHGDFALSYRVLKKEFIITELLCRVFAFDLGFLTKDEASNHRVNFQSTVLETLLCADVQRTRDSFTFPFHLLHEYCVPNQNTKDSKDAMHIASTLCLLFLSFLSVAAADQLHALQSFYEQLGGPNWLEKSGWDGTDVCGFHGITCNGASVIKIELSSNGLSGNFPDIWANLSSLQSLILPENDITGTVPPSLSNCPDLTYIDFSLCHMSGDIGNFGSIPRLQTLGLYGNQFTSISSSFCSLTNIQVLDLGYNLFNFPIPECFGQLTSLLGVGLNNNMFNSSVPSSFANLVNLQIILLNSNQLNGQMINICGMKSLTHIDISDNHNQAIINCNYTGMVISTFIANGAGLSEEIPASMGDLPLVDLQLRSNLFATTVPDNIFSPTIQTLILASNMFHGPISDRLSLCTQLTTFDISYNHFTSMPTDLTGLHNIVSFMTDLNGISSGFPNFANCTQLQTMSLSANLFHGELFQDWSALTQLSSFNIFANDIGGEIPAALSLSPLVTLNLGDNRLTGQIPSSFINLTHVQTIVLSDNSLSGNIPSWLLSLPSMTSLDISFNSFSGPIPLPSSVITLKTLDLSKNKLSGTISQELSDRLAVDQLNLAYIEYNQLSGTPPSFYTGIKQLRLGGNLFSGEVPASIGDYTQLNVLDLSDNQFDGQLPDVFSGLLSLATLTVSGNNFTGPIPPTLRSPDMVTLKMDRNSFSGIIPYNFASMSNLITLDLSSNQLYGDIPYSMLYLSKLQTLSLANNNFTGKATNLANSRSLKQLDLSNNHLTGDIFDDQNVSPVNTALVYLDISHNAFTGKMLFQLPSSLVYFDGSYNQFVDSYVPIKVDAMWARSYLTMTTCKIGYNNLRGYLLTLFTRADFPSLKELDVSGNQLIGPIPPALGQLTQLETLMLENNQLSSEIPKSLGNMAQLTQLNLGSNGLYTEDLSFLLKLNNLQLLNLSNNDIHASIPSNIDSLSRLATFDISHNRMYGQIPSSMYSMRVLTKLYVNNNNMTGQVSAFSADLNEIDLSSNGFDGEATVIDGLVSVTYLNLSRNNLSGPLPDISQKLKLNTIDLSYNQISGSIPSLSALSKLEILQMRSNRLNGSLPSLSRLSSLSFFDVSDNLLNDNTAVRSLPSSLMQCNMSNNEFECPVTYPSISLCQAVCTTSKNDSAVTIQIRVEGQVSDFNQTLFLESLSIASNTSLSRLSILSIKSGSVIINVQISPASEGTTDGTAMRRASMISSLAQTGRTIGPFNVVDAPSNNGGSNNTGLIVGVVVGVACLIIISVIIAGLLYVRSRRSNSVWQNQLSMIDLKSINLGEAKSSITPFSEIRDMKEIGSGAFGIVYRAEWRSLDVAVKQIRAEHVTQAQLTDFMGEVALLQRLRPHPHGSDVSSRSSVSGSIVKVAQCCVTKIIALGMYHLHQEKLAARNILLSRFLEAKVSDFGLSRETQTVDTAAQTQNNIGPLKWMAPEAMRDRIYSQATDVFSFGVTVWEILTEQDPWTNLSPMEAALKVITNGERLEIPDGIEPWLDRLIRDCWEEVPSQRPLFPRICERIANTTKVEEFGLSEGEDAPTRYDDADSFNLGQELYTRIDMSRRSEQVTSPAQKTVTAEPEK